MPRERVTVIGSGRMAPGIAAACLDAGAEVTVAARDTGKAEAATKLAGEYHRAAPDARIASAAIEPHAFEAADCVIETIAEDLDSKLELLGRIEPWLGPEAVLATNTSSFSITALAESLRRPHQFAGFHFLNPAHVTAVVEVIAGERTEPDALDELADLGRRMGKLPLIVRRDVPGFIWNRLQYAMLRECLHLLEEGVADIRSIDAAVSDGLAPRWLGAGPLATADLGGWPLSPRSPKSCSRSSPTPDRCRRRCGLGRTRATASMRGTNAARRPSRSFEPRVWPTLESRSPVAGRSCRPPTTRSTIDR